MANGPEEDIGVEEELIEEAELEQDPKTREESEELVDERTPPMLETGDLEISFAAMTGLGRLDTFKTNGFIKKLKLLVMVDPGSTLNILDIRQVKRLGLHLDRSERFPISVPGDLKIMCEGIIRNVELKMGDYTLRDSFFVTRIGGVDAVLGVQWLYNLGTYSTNHKEDFLSF